MAPTRAQLIVRYFLTCPGIADNRRRVQADVEPRNEANLRLYQNFVCRTKGAHERRRFVQCTPSLRRRGWVGYCFPPAPSTAGKRKR